MSKLGDIIKGDLAELIGNKVIPVTSTVTLAKQAAATQKIQATNAFIPVIAGLTKASITYGNAVVTAKAELQNPITGQDAFYVQPANTSVYYTIVTDGGASDGATVALVIQGTYAGQSFKPFKNSLGDGSIPDVKVKGKYAVVGYVKVTTGATTFTPGTTQFDAANVTSVFTDAVSLA